MTVGDEIADGVAEAFDELRAGFLPDATGELIRIDASVNDFELLLTLTGKWRFDTAKLVLEIADRSAEVKAAVDVMTHFRFNGHPYIADGNRVEPINEQTFWVIECDTHLRKSRFGSYY